MTDQAPAPSGQGTAALLAAPPAAPAPSTPAPAAGSAPAPAAPIEWLKGADDLTVGYVQNKGWKEPSQVLESYRNLEKLMGADKAGNAVILPKPDATPEEMGKFYERLGRPSEPDGYKLPMPEGANPDFAKAASAKMHELGLTKQQGETLAAWWNEQASTAQSNLKAQTEQAYQADDLALKTEWGAAFNQKLAQAQAFVRGAGIKPEAIDKLQSAMGHKATMEFFANLGAKIGEADFVAGTGNQKFGDAMTPAQANAKIAELKRDKGFVARYTSGDALAKAEMQRLISFANPE